ncbi:UbiA family prenyltransferase [Ruegeria marina]|uniref:4-hydroxybenzoate polyprenyltransferase n=1 Tax=Ruegeria marina TaxID=639004 RepID=A0A1G7E291_9RHOB|nr:UbiA family prenyltransferase [Ruegeria marina]SDE57843.1 4-hydroxybenzoate polyprenyltransferase [Ruegeria marina]
MQEKTQHQEPKTIPLVVDVDGTLLRTDLLLETIWAALGRNAIATLLVLIGNLANPAVLKRKLLAIARPDIGLLPERQDVLELVRNSKAQGRSVHLASGADETLVTAVAERFEIPGPNWGTRLERNLTRQEKAAVILGQFGAEGYDYAGNSWADLPSWQTARRIIAVAPDRRLTARLNGLGKPVSIVKDGWTLRDVFREMRLFQWIKNLLIFLPFLAGLPASAPAGLAVLAAALSFGLSASAVYIFNDLTDLDADRRHPEKRHRPIASGRLPISVAMGLGTILVTLSWGIALAVDPLVWAMAALYMVLNLAYSLSLKKKRWIDLGLLATFFLIRLITGAIAANVTVTPLYLGFVFAVFLSLACVKRLTALARLKTPEQLHGRGYRPADTRNLERLAYGSAFASVVLFLLATLLDGAATYVSTPPLMSLAMLPFGLWLARVIRLSLTGREDYDTVVFVTRDKVGLSMLALSIVIFLISY